MAQKRMFNKSITNSSRFLMMPQSSQNLYFHLGMNADDDGFCEHFTIMRMTESKPDDLKILQAKEFVKVFDDKVLIILEWKENNYIRNDRYTLSKYLDIYKQELQGISNGIPKVDKRMTQIRLDKISIDKVSIINTGIDFDIFWNLYDKKENKMQSMKLWNKLSKNEQEECLKVIPEYKLKRVDKKFRKDPDKYLRDKRWLDDITDYNQGNKTQELNTSQAGLAAQQSKINCRRITSDEALKEL